MSHTIPEIDDISPEWLTQALRSAGLDGATVTAVRTSRIGTGQGARCYRFEMDYAQDDPAFPRSLIAKFPSLEEEPRKIATQYKIYLREINFYRILLPNLSITAPRCYYADIDGNGPDFILILEDLTPAVQGDQISGCSVDFARERVMDLVGLHAPTWRNADILDVDWMSNGDVETYNAFIRGAYNSGYQPFLDRCSGDLTAEELDILKRLSETPAFPSEPPQLAVYCATHSDYRLDNFLINDTVTPPTTHVVDWQTLIAGNPMRDLAYFLGGCVLPEDLRPVEEQIVRDYHGALVAAGVTDYPWENCWEDYRRAVFLGIMTAVVGTVFVQQTERGDRLFATMAKRHLQQALALGAQEFIL